MTLPIFTPYVPSSERDQWNRPLEPVDVWPKCAACGCGEPQTDAETGLCRACWRAAVLTPAVLKQEAT